MAAPTIAEMIKFANLQMAAEALYAFDAKLNPYQSPGSLTDFVAGHSKTLTPETLTAGNLHASKFTATAADQFVEQWKVVDHISNTTTGFSGTLFVSKSDPNDFVLSIRSTEFIDDMVRDSVATNVMETSGTDHGFPLRCLPSPFVAIGNRGLSLRFLLRGRDGFVTVRFDCSA